MHDYCGKDTGKIILNGINMDTLCQMVRSNQIKKELCESPRLRVDADDEEDGLPSTRQASSKRTHNFVFLSGGNRELTPVAYADNFFH